MSDVRFYGVTRFSVYQPGSGAWNVSRNAEGAVANSYYDTLYDESRMSDRCALFSKAVEIYQGMADGTNYRHIVHFSKAMPVKWKNYLRGLAARFPVLLLNEVDDRGPNTETVIKSHITSSSASTGPVAWFRVDDDDFLSADYLNALGPYVIEQNVGRGVSFGQGLAAVLTSVGLTRFRHVHWPLLGLGMAYIGWYDATERGVHFPKPIAHSRTDTRFPVILDSRETLFLWIHHLGQDTKSTASADENQRRIDRTFSKWDTIQDVTFLLPKFPSIAGDIRDAVAAEQSSVQSE